MLWGCFSSRVPGDLFRIHGIMNSMKYLNIFMVNLAAPARKLKLGLSLDLRAFCKMLQLHFVHIRGFIKK